MLLIFWFSAQNGEKSSSQSRFLSLLLAQFVGPEHAGFYVRKTAHFTIYLVLGVCMLQSLQAWSVPKTVILQILSALGLCVLYACSDEFHQLFTAGRAGSLTDVLIDSAGALTGCLLSSLPAILKKN